MARPTKAQLAKRKRDEDFQKRYAEQESKRATRVQVDQNIVLWTWLIGVAVAFLTAAVISFNGITSVAYAVGLTFDWMAYLFFFFIEFMYLIFLVAYLVLASRSEAAGGALAGMVFFAGVAVAANAWHTLKYHDYNWVSPDLWAGVVLSISAPIAIIASSKMTSRVALAQTLKEA